MEISQNFVAFSEYVNFTRQKATESIQLLISIKKANFQLFENEQTYFRVKTIRIHRLRIGCFMYLMNEIFIDLNVTRS